MDSDSTTVSRATNLGHSMFAGNSRTAAGTEGFKYGSKEIDSAMELHRQIIFQLIIYDSEKLLEPPGKGGYDLSTLIGKMGASDGVCILIFAAGSTIGNPTFIQEVFTPYHLLAGYYILRTGRYLCPQSNQIRQQGQRLYQRQFRAKQRYADRNESFHRYRTINHLTRKTSRLRFSRI